jgi:cytochrome c biogenesis protein ResB
VTTATPSPAAAPTSPARSARPRRPAFEPFVPIWRVLTSVRFAVSFIGVLALFGLAGVLIPQVPEPMRGNDAAIRVWLDQERDTFGPLTGPMHRLGLFEVFHAKWFLAALGFLVVNVSVCTFNRWAPTFRNVFRPPKRVPESFFDRAHNRTTLAPVDAADLERALRASRFKVETQREGGATYVFADRYPWTQLATFVSHLALVLFIAGGLITWLTGFSAEIFTGEGTTAPVFAVKDPRQLQVRVDQAVGRFGERGNPLDFRTHLTVFRNGEQVAEGTATVNDPFKYGGYRFHQLAYWPDGVELVVRDAATGAAVFHETFPLQDTVAAPAITITDAAGRTLVSDVITPTDFVGPASGTLVRADDTHVFWVGLTPRDDNTWQLVAYDPRAGGDPSSAQLRIGEGESAALSGLQVRFDRVASLPASLGLGVPGGGADGRTLAELARAADGTPTLTLAASDRPAITLAPGEPVTVGAYQYEFVGMRAFAGIGVKRDNGAWFIWVATAMLVGGLAITFYLPRRRLWIKLTSERTQVAALAEKSGGFEKDMRALARRLRVPVPPELEEET